MLTIGNQQIQTLSTVSVCSLLHRLIELLHDSFPESKKVADADMNASIDDLMQRATKYGFQTEEHFGVFVTVAWMMGTNFDIQHQAPQEVLPSPRFTADEKCEWLRVWVETIFSSLDTP